MEHSELDERKVIILKTIIKNYLDTGEPVGSRTISKFSGLNLSSATIRNEMSDLEELGYIIQPHTSAGRIPSDKGYRFYVDSIMQDTTQTVNRMTDLMNQRVDKLESLLKKLVKVLAVDTNYAALIAGPSMTETKIKYLQLSSSSENSILLILVLDGNVIKNEVISVEEVPDTQTIMNLTVMLNNYLSGLTLQEITPRIVTDIMLKAGEHSVLVKTVLDSAYEMMETSGETGGRDIYTSGATNIFKYPELSDVEKASAIISAFEEKDELRRMIADVSENRDNADVPAAGNVRVYLGGEGPIRNMQDCSLVTAHYELGGGMKGVIGVIGPKRMDYEKVLSSVKGIMSELDHTFGSRSTDSSIKADGNEKEGPEQDHDTKEQ